MEVGDTGSMKVVNKEIGVLIIADQPNIEYDANDKGCFLFRQGSLILAEISAKRKIDGDRSQNEHQIIR